MSSPPVQPTLQVAESLSGALMDVLSQLAAKILGGQAVTKDGKPLRDVCYMLLPQGRPIDPRDYSNAWTPGGGSSIADFTASGDWKGPKPPAPGAAATGGGTPAPKATPTVDEQTQHALNSAFQICRLVDQRMLVTTDGSYKPYQGSELVSDAYQAITLKAQGIPADPPPPEIQAKIDAARAVLWKLDAKGQPTHTKTDAYHEYQTLSEAWGQARSDYANAEANAMRDPDLGAAWPVTSQALQQKVDNAYDDWRSNDADEIENALDTLGSVGGAIGAFFVREARETYQAWDLGLTGVVPVGTPYSAISPSSWWDATDDTIAEGITASASTYSTQGSDSSRSFANSWFNSHSQSVGGGGGGMIFGVTFGAEGTHSTQNSNGGWHTDGGEFHAFSADMTNCSIQLEFFIATIDRLYMTSEIFLIDGWYLPGEPVGRISDGDIASTIDGQKAIEQDPKAHDAHLLPMVTTQFLVVRNVKITATSWGDTGQRLHDYATNASGQDSGSSNSVAGSIGFMGFGGVATESAQDFHSSGSSDDEQAGSWSFEMSGDTGTLWIKGSQIVGWVGEILPKSPIVDGVNPPVKKTTTAGTASGGS